MPDLLLIIAEAGAGAFLKPALRAAHLQSGLDWAVATTPVALRSLAGAVSPEHLIAGNLHRSNPEAATALLQSLRPKAVIASAGGWPMERGAITVARDLGTVTVQYIDTWYGYRRRLQDGVEYVLPDEILVIDDRARTEAVAEGLPPERLRICGHPLWSGVSLLPPTDRRDTLFLGAPVKRDYGQSLGYTEDDAWNCLCQVADERPDLFGEIRYAPHPEQGNLPQLRSEVIVEYSTDLLEQTGQVVGMFSAPLIEAYLAGRRSISLQPNAGQPDMAPLSRFGLSPRVTNGAELVAALEQPRQNPAALRASLAGSVERFIDIMETVVRQ